MRPLYVALEGIEGSGKSTQAFLLASHLDAMLTRESGGTGIGLQIRQIVQHGIGGVDPWCEALLFAADRAQHIAEVVDPAMKRGRSVVSDRSLYSSIAYQGFGRGLNVEELFRINSLAVHDMVPNVVLYLAIDQETMNLRLAGRQMDRIEQAGSEFFSNVIQGYEKIRRWAPCEDWFIIDGIGSVSEVAARINAVVDKFIEEWWQ